MRIEQKRVINLSKLNVIQEGKKIRISVNKLEDKKTMLKKLGFSDELNIGETVLPSVIGPASRKNANGYYIIHRDKPKEKHSRMIEWTYKQWSGRGDTIEVTDSTAVEYERYPRTFILPEGIEFTIAMKNDDKLLISPEFEIGYDNEKVKMAINVMLEAFGSCEILDSDNNPILASKTIRLNWDILPKGEYPWEVQVERLKPFLNKSKGKNKAVIERRLEQINKYNPDFTAIGNAGFGGYIIHGFVSRNIYVLESIEVNNATYILNSDWKTISMLTKSEILNNNFHKARVIHNKYWYKEIVKILA